MVKIRKIKCSDKAEWKRGKDEKDFLVCENPKFARVAAVMVSKQTWHDEIMFIEPSLNAVVVPVYKSKEIYLHKEYRPKVMKPGTIIKPRQFDKLKLTSLGVWSLEVPRGAFDKKDNNSINTAKRELREETGIESIKHFKARGRINPNTAYVVSTIPVYIAVCEDKKINEDIILEEDKEKIKDRKFYTIREIKDKIKNNKIFCAVSLAALNLVLQKLEKN